MAEQAVADAPSLEQAVAAGKEGVDNNAGGKNAPGSWETVTVMERPSEIPEKFFKDGVINYKEMAKAYGELEKAKSTPAPAAQTQTPAAQTTPAAEVSTLTIPGIEAASITKYTESIKTTGKLSDADYAELAKVGYPKIVVDSYIKGMTADSLVANAVSEARIADKQIDEIVGAIGGEEKLGEMLAWAQANLDAKDLATYNAAVASADVTQVKLAVNGMFHAFKEASGPNLLSGETVNGGADVKPFGSADEVVAAMQDRRYDRDESYRQEVAKRLSVSNVFGASRDVTHESFARA